MTWKRSFSMIPALLLLALAVPVFGAEETPTPSVLAPPPLMDGIGNSELDVTTSSERAQQYFNQGLRLLHCYWDFEAYRAFKEAARLDPECAMAYWGIYLSLRWSDEFAEERRQAYETTQELADQVTELERFFLRSIGHLEEKSGFDSFRAYERELEHLLTVYPDAVEAKLFLAKSLMRGYSPEGKPYEGQVYSLALLREVLADHPDLAAAHHYWIHATETGPNPELGLESARRVLEMAPASGHMTHMPGHIHYLLGNYEEAREIFLKSREVDLEYMQREGVAIADNWNYVHNLHYLIVTCSESGRRAEARRWGQELLDLRLDHARWHSPGVHAIYHQGWFAVLNLHARFSSWKDLAETAAQILERQEVESAFAHGYVSGLRSYALGRAALESDLPPAEALDLARRHSADMDAHLWRLSQDEGDPNDPLRSGLMRISISSLELRALVQSATGNTDEARQRIEAAIDLEGELGYGEPPDYPRPARQTLGDLHLEGGRWEEARKAFEGVLEQRKNSGFALYGIARSWAGEGKTAEARAAFERFLEAWSHADPDLPQVIEARRYLEP